MEEEVLKGKTETYEPKTFVNSLTSSTDDDDSEEETSSVETKLSTIQKQLNEEKYKDPTDHVVIGQKINLIQQGTALLTPVVNNPRFMVKDKKLKYQTILADWKAQLEPLKQKEKEKKAALDASRKKPVR